MASEKLIALSEVKKKLIAIRQYFSGPPSTEQDKLAQAVVKMCLEEVKKIKPVDAVEVVFCKDCARCKKGFCTIRKDSWGATLKVGLHDFCSYGERRTDNA